MVINYVIYAGLIGAIVGGWQIGTLFGYPLVGSAMSLSIVSLTVLRFAPAELLIRQQVFAAGLSLVFHGLFGMAIADPQDVEKLLTALHIDTDLAFAASKVAFGGPMFVYFISLGIGLYLLWNAKKFSTTYTHEDTANQTEDPRAVSRPKTDVANLRRKMIAARTVGELRAVRVEVEQHLLTARHEQTGDQAELDELLRLIDEAIVNQEARTLAQEIRPVFSSTGFKSILGVLIAGFLSVQIYLISETFKDASNVISTCASSERIFSTEESGLTFEAAQSLFRRDLESLQESGCQNEEMAVATNDLIEQYLELRRSHWQTLTSTIQTERAGRSTWTSAPNTSFSVSCPAGMTVVPGTVDLRTEGDGRCYTYGSMDNKTRIEGGIRQNGPQRVYCKISAICRFDDSVITKELENEEEQLRTIVGDQFGKKVAP